MDALSHVLFGRLLGRLVDVEKRLGPGSRAAFMIGALAPDIDIVTAIAGWDRYLHVHEIGTHTIAASPVVAAAVAFAVRPFVKHSRFSSLWRAAWLSVLLGHLLFDLVSGSDMRILAPIYGARFGPHWLAMADVSAVALLVVGTIASLWRPRPAAIATFVAIGMLLIAKVYTQNQACVHFTNTDRTDPPRVPATAPDAINGSIFEWMFYERQDGALRVWRVNARTGKQTIEFERTVDPVANALAARLSVPAVATFLPLAHVPFPRIERDGEQRFLLWSDLRHCSADWCGLSFGAELDRSDRAIRQVIRIGPVEQSRPMPEVD